MLQSPVLSPRLRTGYVFPVERLPSVYVCDQAFMGRQAQVILRGFCRRQLALKLLYAGIALVELPFHITLSPLPILCGIRAPIDELVVLRGQVFMLIGQPIELRVGDIQAAVPGADVPHAPSVVFPAIKLELESESGKAWITKHVYFADCGCT
jgi:hypothetical protein